ncbi:uncharacterized protein bean1 isoform X4 [Phycodurus eques]|uniref:uncharacterized protein bean1 isoform X4 n=1 Tax=Phycodurus eques TaxID=693459 RepID=UPI002ACDC3DC|nr:uncharacterized protein bean1 isoform X4 [Phycodurus eques]
MSLACLSFQLSSNQSHGEYPDCRSERESGGEASLLVSPLVVAGIVIGLVLFLSCVTIIVGSLRKDSRLRNPHLRATYVTMNAWARVALTSTYPLMTPHRTRYGTPVGTTQRKVPAQPAPPHRPRSIKASHPSPSRRRRRHRTRRWWPTRASPSPSCHVTFPSTDQRGTSTATGGRRGSARSHRTTLLDLSPAL